LDPKLPETDPYLSFCIDDAAVYLLDSMRNGRTPRYVKDAMHRKSVSESLAKIRKKRK